MVLNVKVTVCHGRWRWSEHPLIMIAIEVGNHSHEMIHVDFILFHY